ncbi:MAG: 50S ribosomal protein L17 [Paludibacteraceae bacterium]|nr:50S ribosomal protein L17 [Paludibacteraceae bacterium]
MRHNKKFNHLGRTSSHRSALLSNMACSLIKHKRITTTLAKAKALKMYVEPLINKSKEDSTHSRRMVFSSLQDKAVVAELFRDVAEKVATRQGGYTRILKTGFRLGDAAEMCIIELVDYNENLLKEKVVKKKTTRRAGAKKADAPVVAATTPAPAKEEKSEEKTLTVDEQKVEATVEKAPVTEEKVVEPTEEEKKD